MNNLMRRKLLIAGFSLLVIALIAYGFLPKRQEVDLVSAQRGDFQVTIEEEGRTRLKQRFTVSAPTAGYMKRVDLKVGDAVKKGQHLVILEPLRSPSLDPRSHAQAQLSVSAAQAALEAAIEKERAATSESEYAEKRLERMTNLFSKGYIAKDQFEQSETETKKARAYKLSAKAAVDMARADLERAKTNLQNFSVPKSIGKQSLVYVNAPVNGSVFRLYRESEGAVNIGEPLMDIGNQKDLEIRAEVLSSDAVKIKKGTPVIFKRWGQEETLQGIVRVVEPAGFTKISSLGVEEQRVLVIVDITTEQDKWQALGDGYRLEAHFIIWEGKDILQVPTSALFRQGNQWAVFVAERGKARRRTVEVGQRNGLAAQIISGLSEGEKVVAYPDDAISDGTRIKQRK
ncbi:MAG TPA: efflux RND transporter periplasmic adaptor subunit [Smithellaceae bacterium]|nr:efflux RND transporter periplasmic adaptor subunit [Smithellaceae bacterium]HRS88130.1 efflux RND transporter periplasmic adaptor subunit [Smithellaceae bacterium]HRV25396.1 efflux RND transporter periplasmic adaptor subunit [Smithellaceae bacterium]